MKGFRIWFDPPAFSWGRVLRIAGLWAALVLAVALPITRTVPEPPRTTIRFSDTAPTAVAAATAIARAIPAQAASGPSPPASALTSRTEVFTACGGTPIPLVTNGVPDFSKLAGADVERARQSLLADLRRSGDPWLSAAALFIDTLGARSTPCAEASCAADDGRRISRDPLQPLQALVRMAEASSDPRMQALAMSACRGVASTDTACGRLSVERWAQLDPANAVPWVFVAAGAQARNDTAALGQAMQRIAQATHSDSGWGRLPAALAAHVPPSDAALPAVMKLVNQVIGVQSTALVPSYQPLNAYCSEEALRDSARREQCDDIAQVLAMRSTALTDRVVGLGMARRLGWPAPRLDALQEEIDAVTKATAAEMPGGVEMLSCDGARRTLAHLVEVGRVGEMEAGQRAFNRCCASPPPRR